METPVIILPTLTNRTSFAANNGTLTMAAFQWNSNERGAGKLPHSPQLFGVQRICCHASGVPVPGSGVGHSALLLLQGPHQTTGLGVGLWVCMHVWERCMGLCVCAFCSCATCTSNCSAAAQRWYAPHARADCSPVIILLPAMCSCISCCTDTHVQDACRAVNQWPTTGNWHNTTWQLTWQLV